MLDPQRDKNDDSTKEPDMEDTMRDEYDFSSMQGGVRGKYVHRYQRGEGQVTLDPDVAAVFPTSNAVNEALRSLIRIARAEKEERQPSDAPIG